MHAGQKLKILGVLGNGFPIEKADGKSIFVMGGGIGIPPMLQTVISLQQRGEAKNINAVLGYRSERFLMEEFTQHCLAYAATEDGSYGTKGNVMDLVREHDLKGDMIFACGPMPMLRAVKEFAQANNIEAYISLEERMACGVGACLGCVCKTKETDAHSKVHNARICTDGPVFEAGSALLDHIGDAVGEGAGRARAGTGNHHHGAFYGGNGLTLRLVKVFHQVYHYWKIGLQR